MAIAGVFIAWSFEKLLFPTGTTGSELMASAGTSSTSSTGDGNGRVRLLSIDASVPIFYAVGPAPDASGAQRRYHDPANGRDVVVVDAGDRFSWVAA